MAELLTVDEAAERLRVSRSTVKRLIRAGSLRSAKVGRARLIPIEELRRYIEAVIE